MRVVLERAAKVMMPALFLIILLLLVYGAVAGDMSAAFQFMFVRPFSHQAGCLLRNGPLIFTLSLGMGAIGGHGSYLWTKTHQLHVQPSLLHIADTAIALMARAGNFQLFCPRSRASNGPGLILQTLLAFSQMPFGAVVEPLFFDFDCPRLQFPLIEPFACIPD